MPQVRGNTAEFSENSDSIRSMRIAVVTSMTSCGAIFYRSTATWTLTGCELTHRLGVDDAVGARGLMLHQVRR